MRFLLDTNICIYIIKCKLAKVFEKFETLKLSDVGVSSITIMDLLIASQAISQNLVLVTNNVRELSRISGLILENWTE